MSSTSEFVVRLEVDVRSLLAANLSANSPVVEAGGLEWAIAIRPQQDPMDLVQFFLTCNPLRRGDFECEVEAKFRLLNTNDEMKWTMKPTFNNGHRFDSNFSIAWSLLKCRRSGYCVNGKIAAEFHVKVLRLETSPRPYIPDLACLCSHNDEMNVTLIIGEQRVQVSKDFLALHSPVFATMFYGMFKENGRDEVEIKDVDYEEFIDLLSFLYSRRTKILDSTLCHILELADRFEMKDVIHESSMHLISSDKFSNVEKLQLADRYRLPNLRDSCLLNCNDAQKMQALKASLKLHLITLPSLRKPRMQSASIVSQYRGKKVWLEMNAYFNRPSTNSFQLKANNTTLRVMINIKKSRSRFCEIAMKHRTRLDEEF